MLSAIFEDGVTAMDAKKIGDQLRGEIKMMEDFLKFLEGKVDAAVLVKPRASLARLREILAEVESGKKP